jgi:hypothetical protein
MNVNNPKKTRRWESEARSAPSTVRCLLIRRWQFGRSRRNKSLAAAITTKTTPDEGAIFLIDPRNLASASKMGIC